MGSLLGLTPEGLQAQGAGRAVLTGEVTDPSGAVIPGAAVRLLSRTSAGFVDEVIDEPFNSRESKADATGKFQFTVPGGTYVLSVEVPGFAVYTGQPLVLKPNASLRVPVRLAIASAHEELSVLDDESSGAGGGGADMVLEGDSLRFLSNDTATLRQQLSAFVGGTPHFIIDGFEGGRLPAKSSIQSIRINRNPYSAYFADLGMGRVEITTRPGTDKLHGALNLSGTDQPLDARNPYLALSLPFYDVQQDADVNGPIGKKTSFFVSDAFEDLANNAVVNAADPLNPSATVSEGLPAPQRTETFSARFDRQFSERNFGYVREEWSRNHIVNSGINPLVLPAAAFTADTLTNTLQLVDTQTIGAHAVNDVRFQYLRTRVRQDPNSTRPSVVVQSSFQDGGSPAQVLRDNQDTFELQELFELTHGAHAIRAGFRFRAMRDANESSANFNGQYIFPDVSSYLAGLPSQFSVTTGQQGAVLRTDDVGLFAEDDWKVTPNLTFSYGFRFESESAVPDHADPAPRFGFTYAVRPGKRKTPIVTLRGGYGIFYDRFPATQLLASIRQNGVSEVAYVAQGTGFNPDGLPPGVVLSATEPTIFRVDPALRTSYAQSASFTVSRSLGRFGSLAGNLLYEHNTHNYLTRNINAPLPGTYDPADPASGVRPLGTSQNIYQFSSQGNGNRERFHLTYRLQVSSKLMAFGTWYVDKMYNEVDGIDRFPSNQYDLRADYARAGIDQKQNFNTGIEWTMPFGFQTFAFLAAKSGQPFDLTTGTDLNGDTVYNDRPAFATDVSRASVVKTDLGQFDTAPTTGQTILPRNYLTAPGLLWLDLRVSRDFHLGPRPRAVAGGTGGPAPDRPWSLGFAVDAQNLLNHTNSGVPVGVLAAQTCGSSSAAPCTCAAGPGLCPLVPSQYFGHSLSLAPYFGPDTASNRTILLQTTFTF